MDPQIILEIYNCSRIIIKPVVFLRFHPGDSMGAMSSCHRSCFRPKWAERDLPSEFGLFVSLDVEIAKGYGRQVVGKKTSKHIPTGNDMMEFYLGPSCYVIILTIPLREHPSRNRLLFFRTFESTRRMFGVWCPSPFLHFSGWITNLRFYVDSLHVFQFHWSPVPFPT